MYVFLRHGGIQILALFIVGEEIYQKYKAHNDKIAYVCPETRMQ